MSAAVAAFSAGGLALARRVAGLLNGEVFVPQRLADTDALPMEGGLACWAERAFRQREALVFVGAVGIAVRAIAPHVRSKTQDPAVVALDEGGRFVIPLLSGHIGGANELAQRLARALGAQPVITTATDVRGLPAVDSWAVAHDLAIENPPAIKAVSGCVLEGLPVGVAITERAIQPPFPVTLLLRPRTLVVGVGCRRGQDGPLLEAQLMKFLALCGVSLLSVRALATIDRKRDEPALLRLSQRYQLPLHCFTAQELRQTPGVFSASEWVERSVGVDNVCERAAMRLSGGRLLMGKTIYEGATFALCGEEES